jgi:hypothetical protein
VYKRQFEAKTIEKEEVDEEGEYGVFSEHITARDGLHIVETTEFSASRDPIEIEAKIKAHSEFRILISDIVASGRNNNFGTWRFNKHQSPLLGDINMMHIISTPFYKEFIPENQNEIELRVTVQLSIKGIKIINQNRMTDWINIKLGH